MTPLCIRNWDKWQSYRQDRGTPPWIKVHRVLFTNPDWATLTDAEKGQLVSLWIAAADNHGCIPDDCRVLRKICLLDSEPNINKFIELGFIKQRDRQVDAKLTPNCQPHDAPETETETETEKNTTYSVGQPKKTVSRPRIVIPFLEIIKTLNEKAGTNFKPNSDLTKRHIRARWNEGFRLPDFEAVIESKINEWATNPDMVQYLRPKTLFGTNFESYLQNSIVREKPREEKVYTLPDLDELRRKKQAEKQQAGIK